MRGSLSIPALAVGKKILGSVDPMWYNVSDETNRIQGRFLFPPLDSQSDIVGKAPSMCELRVPLLVSSTMATHGGLFAMGIPKSERATNEFCLCGCGGRISKNSRMGYRIGHWMRSDGGREHLRRIHKGKKISKEQRKLISQFFKG